MKGTYWTIPVLALAVPVLLGAQSRVGATAATPRRTLAAATTTAARTPVPVVLDGKDADPAWKTTAVIDGFRTFRPVANGDPRFRTEARVLYDEKNLYVLVRMFDSHPDSIVGLMSRRDVRTQSDWVTVMLDPFLDRRSGFQFAVNPGGVQRDFAIVNDQEEDESWNAVWDVATRVDSAGWVAEFRIPLNQLRYENATDHTFGIMIVREVARYNERYSWPLLDRTTNGLSSQFGDVTGINGVVSPRRVEAAPYTVARTYNAPRGPGFAQKNDARVGADLKYGLTSNLTIDAAVNPDFGQVEADPSEVNLSAFETFFKERRPFFLEGKGLFRYDISCQDDKCSGLFYSRRIGRSPQLSGYYPDLNNARSSTILGAAKLTGRLANGVTLGLLNAVAQREVGARTPSGAAQTIEPQTSYFVARAGKDYRAGASAIGAILTSVNRSTDLYSDPFLRRAALTGGLDARHQFLDRKYSVSGYFAGSRVTGSAASIAATQMSTSHNYQRPDDGLVFDPTRTSLDGYSAQLALQKRAGGRTRASTGLQVISPGFEVNDVGFLAKSNTTAQWVWLQYQWNQPTRVYRQGNINFNQWTNWGWGNLRTELGGNVNSQWELANSMWLRGGVGMNGAVESYCDDCLRGGPAVRKDRSLEGWWGIEGDPRHSLRPMFWGWWHRRLDGRGFGLNIDPSIQFRVGGALNGSLGYGYFHGVTPNQFIGISGDIGHDTTHYTVARVAQAQRSVTARMSYTVTPELSVEVFGRPFTAHGDYSNWLEVANPRADRWADRYTPFNGGDPGAFDFKQHRSNTVVRWEYRPGSTLYFVWAQERTIDIRNPNAARSEPQGLRVLKKAHPDNVFLIKASYWFSM